MSDEEWVRVAMGDDLMVVEVLLRLHQAEPPPPPPPHSNNTAPTLQLEWSVRQRRSKPLPRKKSDSTRASPTTPLSWSGATSVSGGVADGFEESSRPAKQIDSTRSKVSFTGETTAPKRSRKKKTLTELKEEESLLLKERISLKNELETLRQMVEKQRTSNESLKRRKVDWLSRQTTKTEFSCMESEVATPVLRQEMEPASETTCRILPTGIAADVHGHAISPNGSSKAAEVGSRETPFVLPDLNLPIENDSGPELPHGIS